MRAKRDSDDVCRLAVFLLRRTVHKALGKHRTCATPFIRTQVKQTASVFVALTTLPFEDIGVRWGQLFCGCWACRTPEPVDAHPSLSCCLAETLAMRDSLLCSWVLGGWSFAPQCRELPLLHLSEVTVVVFMVMRFWNKPNQNKKSLDARQCFSGAQRACRGVVSIKIGSV